MFEQLSAPDHVVAMRLSGKLTGDDVSRYKNLFDRKLEDHERVGVCADLTGFSDMTLDAILTDAKVELELATYLNQIGRVAFVSDKEWPQALIQLSSGLFPTLAMKSFTPDQVEAAIQWSAELPEAAKSETHAIRFLPTTEDDVLGFEINGTISAEEMPDVIKEFDTFLAHHEKVRLLNRMKHFGGIDPEVFMQGGLISMKLSAMNKVERYAIVGAPGWMSKIIGTMNSVFGDIDMQTFPADREDEAWAWLGARPV